MKKVRYVLGAAAFVAPVLGVTAPPAANAAPNAPLHGGQSEESNGYLSGGAAAVPANPAFGAPVSAAAERPGGLPWRVRHQAVGTAER